MPPPLWVRLQPDSCAQRDPDFHFATAAARVETRTVALEVRRIRRLMPRLRQPLVPDRGPRAANRRDMAAVHEYGVAVCRHAHSTELRGQLRELADLHAAHVIQAAV